MTRLTKEIGASGRGGRPALHLAGPPQAGTTLLESLKGHEHFGFKDGISQPAIRGLASKDPTDFFDARLLASTDRNFDYFAEPGRPLVWPGQFLLGYNRQDPEEALKPKAPAPLEVGWQRNGSYLVYRRLRQKVHLFWQFCENGAQALGGATNKPVSREFFAASLIGRWPSGAPLMRAPTADDAQLADDGSSNNNFSFANPTALVTLKDGKPASSVYPPPPADPYGRICPFVGHIRKVNPRDDDTEQGGPHDTLRRLMLRRGIPYGPPQDRAKLLEDDGVDRGLLFMAYQSSITDQFRFVTHTWANQANAPHDSTPETGDDPLISQNAGQRFIRLPIDGDPANDRLMALPEDPWVVMTGGGYFFTPSVSALAGALAEESSSSPRSPSRTGTQGLALRQSVRRRPAGPRNPRGAGR